MGGGLGWVGLGWWEGGGGRKGVMEMAGMKGVVEMKDWGVRGKGEGC